MPITSRTASVENEVTAYHTEVKLGEDFEQYSQTGPYADIGIKVAKAYSVPFSLVFFSL